MFTAKKPSLRHFAVIERAHRNRFGSTWLVQDRRNQLRKQHLFVPSRLRSWPIWQSRLELIEPTPTRLRNGRVAILISAADSNEVREALRKRTTSSSNKLNALTGFEKGDRKSKLRMVLLPAVALGFCLLLIVPKEESLATPKVGLSKQKVQLSCALPIEAGALAVGSVRKFGFLEISGSRYKIASVQKLGGLAQVKLKRVCDKRYVRLDLWFDQSQLRVEKVY